MTAYNKGIAFIFEGETERVFYDSVFEYYLDKHKGYMARKEFDNEVKEFYFVLSNDARSTVIKTYTVGTVIAHTRACANWFKITVIKGINKSSIPFQAIEDACFE